MTSSRYVVGIDCGTQSAKVIITDETGHVVAQAQEPLRPMDRPRHGVAVHPDDDLWRAICAATRSAILAFGGDRAQIVAVGLCPIRCCKAFLAEDGSLIEPLMSWMDERAYRPYLPTDSRLRWATTASGYVAHRFTGLPRDTSANNIDIQWPIDTDTWQWSTDPGTYDQHGVTRDLLFELQMPGDVIGPLTANASRESGLPEGIAVVQTANDKAVEMLGIGPVGEATALVSLGTYIAAMMRGTGNHRSPTHFWTNFSSVPNHYLYESNGIRRGMWTLTWFLDLLGHEIGEHATSLGLSREKYLEREARDVAAGSDGLLTVLDWLAPDDKPFRKGTMFGFDARHTRGHIYRSILEAIALTMKSNVDAMCGELGISLNDIVLSGGGARSELFVRIFADVFGVPASRSVDGHGAAMGAAMCAAAAAGLHATIDDASAAMSGSRESFLPDLTNTARYEKILSGVYRDLRSATDPVYERAFPIFHGPHSLDSHPLDDLNFRSNAT